MKLLQLCLVLLFAVTMLPLQLGLFLVLLPLAVLPEFRQRLGWINEPKSNAQRTIWIHAASLGEWRAATALVERLKAPIHATYLSRTMQKANQGDAFAPLDLWPAILIRIWRIRPSALVIVEVDLWPTLLWIIWCCRIPIVWVNARADRSMGKLVPKFRGLFAPLWSSTSYIHCLDQNAGEAFLTPVVKAKQSKIAFNLKWLAESNSMEHHHQEEIPSTDVLLASIHRDELEVANQVLAWASMQARSVRVVPRYIEDAPFFTELGTSLGANWIVEDQYGRMGFHARRSRMAIVGATFNGGGGHNPIELAVHGCMVLSGPAVFSQVSSFELLEQVGNWQRISDVGAIAACLNLLDDQQWSNEPFTGCIATVSRRC